MSATRGNGEHWKSLESVGISRKELALAEALQMEYDALTRLRQDKEETQAKQNTDQPLISWDDPIPDYNKPAVRNDCHNIKVMRGLSGSDPTLNYNGQEVSRALGTNTTTSSSLLPEPENQPWLKEPLSSDYLYIFDSTGRDFPLNSTSCHNSGSSISPKNLSPPPLPPRIAIWNTSEVNQTSLKGSQPNDINMFSSAHERADGKLLGRRISEEDAYSTVDYDGINDAITRLNLKSTYDTDLLREATWSWKEGRSIFEKESSGKPVARSKTMPPQVPPRTYVSRSGGRKNGAPNKNRRISADPVSPFFGSEKDVHMRTLCPSGRNGLLLVIERKGSHHCLHPAYHVCELHQ